MESARLQGQLFAPQSSQRSAAVLCVEADGRVFVEGEDEACGTLRDLRIPGRVGNTARVIALPDGRRFETRDNTVLDTLLHAHRGPASTLAHRLESNFRLIAIAVVLAIAASYLAVTRGIPAAADYSAARIPADAARQLGAGTLAQLDDGFLGATELDDQRRAELLALFRELASRSKEELRLVFRSGGPFGANALALPDGTIVLTDELVELAANDTQVAAVLLHEIGHVEARHGLRAVLRQAGLATLVIAISGDVSTASSLVIALPTVLLTMQYSRDFEREADGHALQQMLELGLDPGAFADMMRSLERSARDDGSRDEEASADRENDARTAADLLAYFASHPATEERIRRFDEAAATLHEAPAPARR